MEAEQLNQTQPEVVAPVATEAVDATDASEKSVPEVQMNESEAQAETVPETVAQATESTPAEEAVPASETSATEASDSANVAEPTVTETAEQEPVPEVDMEAEPTEAEKSTIADSSAAETTESAPATESVDVQAFKSKPLGNAALIADANGSTAAVLLDRPKEDEPIPDNYDNDSLTAETAPTNEESVVQTAAAITNEVSNLEEKVGGDSKTESDDKDASVLNQSNNANGVKSDSTSPQQPAASASAKKPKIDLASMAVRQYLDHTVVPILLAGLAVVAKVRPEQPIDYLVKYLLDNKYKYDNNQENSSINGNQ